MKKRCLISLLWFCCASSVNSYYCEYTPLLTAAICPSIKSSTDEARHEWTNLKIKNFGNQSLGEINRRIFNRVPRLNIVSLDAITNNIKKRSFQGLKDLQSIELFNNDLKSLPSVLFQNLSKLMNVYIIACNTERLEPGTFQGLKKLRAVFIRNNSINVFPANVVSESNIEELYVENNGIEIIEPLAFVNMPELRRLSLSGNKLSSFDVPLLLGSNSLGLEKLWLGNNKLAIIKSNNFALLPNLKYLFLELNQIKTIERDAFNKLQKLIGLDISNNELWEIPPNIFSTEGMKSLELFLFHYNRVTFVNTTLFEKKPKLKFVTFYGNPLQCPCYIDIKDFLAKIGVKQVCEDNENESRPNCIKRTDNRAYCSYDLEQNKYLYEDYRELGKSWKPWLIKCQYAEGYDNLQWAQFFNKEE